MHVVSVQKHLNNFIMRGVSVDLVPLKTQTAEIEVKVITPDVQLARYAEWSCESATHWEHNYSRRTIPTTRLLWKKGKEDKSLSLNSDSERKTFHGAQGAVEMLDDEEQSL